VASKVTHIARFAVQDWRTSKIRARSSTTQDPMLRTVYFEILLALYESGGRLPADPELLSDTLLLPAEEISRCLPILLKFGQSGRGGLQLQDSYIHNARVDEDLEEEKEYRLKQAERGRLRHQPPLSHRSATAQPPLDDGSAGAEGTVSQHMEPLSQPECALSLPLPLPPPSPLPLPSSFPSPNPSLFPEGEESERSPANEPLGFKEFWEAYPRKVGRGAARKAWMGAKKSSSWPGRTRVIQAALDQAESPKWRTEPQFIPHPSTWLNQERWSDATGPPVKRTNGVNIEQVRLAKMYDLAEKRGQRGEEWYEQVVTKVQQAKTIPELEALS
jgi:hypothetical protein